jgi:hypothetical protein
LGVAAWSLLGLATGTAVAIDTAEGCGLRSEWADDYIEPGEAPLPPAWLCHPWLPSWVVWLWQVGFSVGLAATWGELRALGIQKARLVVTGAVGLGIPLGMELNQANGQEVLGAQMLAISGLVCLMLLAVSAAGRWPSQEWRHVKFGLACLWLGALFFSLRMATFFGSAPLWQAAAAHLLAVAAATTLVLAAAARARRAKQAPGPSG